MTLSDLSIKRPVFAWMVMTALIVFGIISFKGMGVSQLPNVEFPVVSVSLTWPGAAPEVMESQVVDVVEEAVTSVEGIRSISSSVNDGSANITIEFNIERDVDFALQEVQARISQAQRRLPDDLEPPVVRKTNPAQQPITWLSLRGDRPTRDLMEYTQDHLEDQFASIKGVGDIFLGGFTPPSLRVWVDQGKLIANELTVDDVVDAIQKQHSEMPAGRLETEHFEQDVRAMGEARNADEFGNISIPTRHGQLIYKPIFLKDVAVVEDGLDEVRRISRTDGKPSVGLGIRKQIGSNEVEVSHGVTRKLQEVRKNLPAGMQLEQVVNRSKFIEESINELVFTLVLSAIVTSLVCWLFLGSWSATFNILMAIPTSIIGTFIVIKFLGFTLNTFTVLGLSLAIGIVVDDSIMVLENIVRYQEKGMDRVRAAQEGARQITFAALAATLAIIAIFLPVAFMSGIIGKFFFEFGVTISVAVAISLLEALMLTPMRCAQFLQAKEHQGRIGQTVDRWFKRLAVTYQRGLQRVLRHRWKVVIGSLVFFVLSLGIFNFLRKEFLPPQDQSMFVVNLRLPVGSSLAYTDERMKEVEKFITGRPEVLHYFAAVGGFGGGKANSGNIFVSLKPRKERPVVAPSKRRLSQQELMAVFRKELNKIPDVKAFIQDLSQGGFSARRGFPIEMSIQGPDWEKLWEYAKSIRDQMAKTSQMVDVDTDYQEGAKEIDIIPDRVRAAERGVEISAINQVINAMVGGQKVGEYTHNGKRYDIRVRLLPDQRQKVDDILGLWVWNSRGEMVQLKDMVKVVERPTPVTITRNARQRSITIFANVAPGKSQAAAVEEARRIVKSVLPDGYAGVLTGSSQAAQESNKSLVFVFLLGIFVAYMVLASQFNSYVHPFTILMALPFSISGALIALWLGQQSLNLYSMIGLILLAGIVKKNSILLVEFTNQLREQGMAVKDALLTACPIRLRPILMTSAATIAAAVPPALAIGPGAEVRIPMSIAVIGGVIVSTFFTLFVVPCVYSLFTRLEHHPKVSSPPEIPLPKYGDKILN